MIRVTHNYKRKKISIGYSCKKEHWNFETSRFRKNYPNCQIKNGILLNIESRISDILNGYKKNPDSFSLQNFEEEFKYSYNEDGVFSFLDGLIINLGKKGKIGNQRIYQDLKRALEKFNPNSSLVFIDIDYKFLQNFETHLFERGCASGGISVYMRTLRAIINEAIRQGAMKSEHYPFSTQHNKNGYSLSHLKSATAPRALTEVDMAKIKKFDSQKFPQWETSIKFFLFSYYARGMNFTDMALLHKANIINGRLTYNRKKTGGYFNLKISAQLKSLIDYFNTESEFVLPILNKSHKTPTQIKDRITKCLKKFNGDLKDVGTELEIQTKLTSYVARHQYATTLKRGGVDIGLISENMGHKNIDITNAYLKKFEQEKADEADEVL